MESGWCPSHVLHYPVGTKDHQRVPFSRTSTVFSFKVSRSWGSWNTNSMIGTFYDSQYYCHDNELWKAPWWFETSKLYLYRLYRTLSGYVISYKYHNTIQYPCQCWRDIFRPQWANSLDPCSVESHAKSLLGMHRRPQKTVRLCVCGCINSVIYYDNLNYVWYSSGLAHVLQVLHVLFDCSWHQEQHY